MLFEKFGFFSNKHLHRECPKGLDFLEMTRDSGLPGC
jgi:hypothetical protein